ncbi:PTS system, ascorbate-specific IIC component [Pelagirhabdus alkalitolerans]|uniref:Ascorbate-specific PTS system EIIC component n=1 Tax=Pelagirhabdus alkalitolerans TaxID=1612202 RepID=A0A1G6GGP4_9BACI|nr:PTS ascorbate transporter subunit IIC [Pelagirhabdus alkalitolerans]SDB80993.1 PTS system, ascorbate-specific IIC component [Pelagirhabdus alkalitolerans]
MDLLMYIINNVLSDPMILIGIVIIIGSIAQKDEWHQTLPSTIKAMIGFQMINVSSQQLGMSLLPLQPMFGRIFGIEVGTTDIGAAQAAGLQDVGSEMALIFVIGFIAHVILARISPMKYVHLSAHVSFFFSGLIAALLMFNTNLSTIPLVIIGSLILAVYLSVSSWYVDKFMYAIKGGEDFTLGHSSSIGIVFASLIGKYLGNKSKDLEEIKLPKSLNFVREMSISLTLVMFILFLVLSIFAGPTWVMENLSDGQGILLFSITSGILFGLWITVIITGVRMLLSEVLEAFNGIADRIIPDAKPGLDVPVLFPSYPNSVPLGFLMSLLAGLVGTWILGLVGYPIVVFPALIPTFFTGAITAIFGNAHGGRRGAVLGSTLNGFILIFGQALLLPMVGSYEAVMRVLSETDYTFWGPLLGYILRLLSGGS